MKMSQYEQAMREALLGAAGIGDELTRATAEKLVAAVSPALRLQSLTMAAELAEEVNQLSDGTQVDVLMTPEGPVLRVATFDPVAAQEEATPIDTDAAETARITLRIPTNVKVQADEAARAGGKSLNAWIVGAIRRGLSPDPSFIPGPGFRSASTVGAALHGWVS